MSAVDERHTVGDVCKGEFEENIEMAFSDEEIERTRRQTVSKRVNVDHEQIQEKRDLIFAARTDTPEEFQARMAGYGFDLSSEQGKKIMEAYWAIRREPRR